MIRKILLLLAALMLLVVLYFLVWPVPVEPKAWVAPPNPGYTGPYAVNTRLAGLTTFSLAGNHGPEDVAVDARGRIYAATHEGRIVRLQPDGSGAEVWADTGGRPLGIDFDAGGNLIVADAFRGLLMIAPDATVSVLATEADGIPIRYADDVDTAADGRIYFSDASTRFGAKQWGGTYPASLLDLMEHSGSGRLLVFDPADGRAHTVLKGLTFANGVAVSPDQRFVLVNETGMYRVMRYWLQGPKAGTAEPLIEALPGFPDNVSAGQGGRFWVALVSPRNALLDGLAGRPFLRKVIQRLPAFVRPQAVPYGHVLAVDADGTVVADLQDPTGAYPINTGAVETERYLYICSLVTPVLARLDKSAVGL